jgi:hypothetical protein
MESQYPTIAALWQRNWERVIPFFAFPAEVRKVIYTTNAVESLNMSLRKALKTRVAYPAVDLTTIGALKPDFLAGLDEPANRFQAQLLCFVHADVQSPACLTLQAHLVLESIPPFRLILHWKRVAIDIRKIMR